MTDRFFGLLDAPMSEGEALARRQAEAEPNNGQHPAPDAGRRYWTVADLMAAEFPEPRWVVPDLVPAGLTLLAGRPKLGKSFLALQLCVAVGAGGVFLGHRLDAGRALYVALEDSPRRLRSRLRKMHAEGDAGNLVLAFTWPDLGGPGLDELRATLARHSPSLVVVDTLARSFSGRVDWDRIGAATEALAGVQAMALEHDCAVLLVDHHRKPGVNGANLVDDVLSSTGKTAVADTILGLYRERGKAGATLHVTGRDMDDAELRLSFDRDTCCWHVVEDADGVRAGSVQAEIVAALGDLGGKATVTELSVYLERPHGNVSRELAELVAKGVVHKESADRYAPYVLS